MDAPEYLQVSLRRGCQPLVSPPAGQTAEFGEMVEMIKKVIELRNRRTINSTPFKGVFHTFFIGHF